MVILIFLYLRLPDAQASLIYLEEIARLLLGRAYLLWRLPMRDRRKGRYKTPAELRPGSGMQAF